MNLETFFEKFELFANAPNGVERMRELVYQLAVQGKLVTQDATEESASVLLEKIRKEKSALSRKRRGQAEIEATEFDDEAAPFAPPVGWVWTRLGEVQVFTNGYAF